MKSTLKVSDIPTFDKWIEKTKMTNDNMISAHINELQSRIGELVCLEDELAPIKGELPSEQYTVVNAACRTMALILSDMKTIRCEAKAAYLCQEGGEK